MATAGTSARAELWTLVGGPGQYLNSQIELARGVLELITTHRDRFDDAFADR